jgi:NAD+ synthetase
LIAKGFERYNSANDTSLELVGYILPSRVNAEDEANDALNLAKQLGIRYEVHGIENLVAAYESTNPEAFQDVYHKGNLTARVRANVLSTKAAAENKILAGTGNKDEDFGIGYYTLFGDGAVHLSPIGGLSKRLVREMAVYLGLKKNVIHRFPTAGLEPGQSDFKDLGYDYDVVELVTEGLAQGFTREQIAQHEQVLPLIEQQIVKYKSLFEEAKFETAQQVVTDILRRHKLAMNKVKILHPPTPKITLNYD